MAEYRTHYQPAWIDFSMFWSAIVIGLSLAIIVQLESTKPSWLAIAIAAITILTAIGQILLLRLIATEKGIRLTSLFKSNTINLSWSEIEGFTSGHLTVMLKAKQYGRVSFLMFGKKRKQKIVALIEKGLETSTK
ncbi:EbsA family protein [Lacticaseibacillus chiayiensis]|uniref:EbsA family protein n=1 Tax=Lacticaseibacillus chiayiensis TaxID=2100821 RepID=UPI003C7388C5